LVYFYIMKLLDTFQKIDTLNAELSSLLPMNPLLGERLDKKFRLEWNYNSNHIEGNTLSYSETELLLIFDRTIGDHEMREYEEMKAHDVAVRFVYELARDPERELNEAFIKQLNEIIMVRPFWKPAVTIDGHDTRRLIDIGTYKKHPNSVRLSNGEIFHYASPEETPALMGDFISEYRSQQHEGLHPLQVAAELHYDFVRLHPFDDGNGRISRLLMNYHLIRNGFPPVIIKTSDKNFYLAALNRADVGDIDVFVEFVAKQLINSLRISIDTARGFTVEEAFVKYGVGSE
jgi:Fic family protein